METYFYEVEQEKDGRWIADFPVLPGVMSYGETQQVAVENAIELALRTLGERKRLGDYIPAFQVAFKPLLGIEVKPSDLAAIREAVEANKTEVALNLINKLFPGKSCAT